MKDSDSLKTIDKQLKKIMNEMGIDIDRQDVLLDKLCISSKMNMIVSMQTPTKKEELIKKYLQEISVSPSITNIVGLRSAIQTGPQVVYDVFTKNKGHEILSNSIPKITGDMYKYMLECIFIITTKYEPIEEMVKQQVLLKLIKVFIKEKSCYDSFFIILDLFSKKSTEDTIKVLFRNTQEEEYTEKCVCNSYFLEIVKKIIHLPNITNELNFIYSLLKNSEKYILLIRYVIKHTNFIKKMREKDLNLKNIEMLRNIEKLIEGEDVVVEGCGSNRIFEILRIVEKMDVGYLNLITCVVESLVFGKISEYGYFYDLEKSIDEKYSKISINGGGENLKTEVKDNVFSQSKDLNKDTNVQNPIVAPSRRLPPRRVPKIEATVEPKIESPQITPTEKEELNKVFAQKLTTQRRPPPKKVPVKKKPLIDLSKYQKTYMPLRWNKMQKGETVWKNINLQAYQDLFDPSDFVNFEKEIRMAPSSFKEKVQVRTALSAKKGNAVSIALGRVKENEDALVEDIFCLKSEEVGENLLKQLIVNFPEKEEIEKLVEIENVIKKNNTNSDNDENIIIGRAESLFLKVLANLNDFKECINFLYFKATFLTQTDVLSTNMGILNTSYVTIINSTALREFLTLSLCVGNILNGSSLLGNAEGYTLESLRKFNELVGYNKDTALTLVRKKFVNNATLIADLTLICKSSKINYDGLISEVKEIKESYEKIKKSQNKKVIDEMSAYEEKYIKFIDLHDTLCCNYGKVCVFLGEKVSEDTFNILENLLRDISS